MDEKKMPKYKNLTEFIIALLLVTIVLYFILMFILVPLYLTFLEMIVYAEV